jgi:hypothetical protein
LPVRGASDGGSPLSHCPGHFGMQGKKARSAL